MVYAAASLSINGTFYWAVLHIRLYAAVKMVSKWIVSAWFVGTGNSIRESVAI